MCLCFPAPFAVFLVLTYCSFLHTCLFHCFHRCRRTPQVRSNLWPGYVFDHAVDGTQFAGAYIGNGVRQDDVAFML